MKLLILFINQFHAASIRNSNTNPCILHGAANAHRFSCCQRSFIFRLYCFQGLHKTCGIVNNLTIWKCLPGPDRIAVADLPWSDSHLICHHIQKCLCSKTGLGNSESTERSSRWIIGIISGSLNLKVFVVIRASCMGTCPLQNRTAKRCKCTCIRSDLCLYPHNISILITSHSHIHIERMTFRMHKQGLRSCQLHLNRLFGHIGKKCA